MVNALCLYELWLRSNEREHKIQEHMPYSGDAVSSIAQCECSHDLVLTI